MLEDEIQQLIQIEGPKYGCFLMRNNSGALNDETGRPVRYGLGNVSKQHNDKIKSSDLIGFTIINGVAVFTAIEVKRGDWKPDMLNAREVAQNAFIQWVRKNGGLAGFANSVEMFRRILGV